MEKKPVCVVVGVGPGNGASLARRFATEGYAVALLARSAEYSEGLAASLPGAKSYACDVTDAAAIETTFGRIRSELGDPSVLVYNAGSGVWGNVEEISSEDFEKAWRINTLGALQCSKQVIPAMKRDKHGAIVFIGATASRRGGARFTAFASAKAAQRSLAESMGRQLWPSGIHVCLIVVDGVVDLERTRKMMPDKPDSFFIRPDDVAETAFSLCRQNPSGWSFEVEVRPFAETW
jgi:NAD(P)-dependent dehydrogenase (short-subunit alcohol dehydrogenase family)